MSELGSIPRVPASAPARAWVWAALAAAIAIAELRPEAPGALVPTSLQDGVCGLSESRGPRCACPDLTGRLALLLGRPIRLNQARAEDLMALPGVGPARAAAIVSYRDVVGDYASVATLGRVPGLGPVTVARLAPMLSTEGCP